MDTRRAARIAKRIIAEDGPMATPAEAGEAGVPFQRCEACGKEDCRGVMGRSQCDERPTAGPAAPGDTGQPLPPGHAPIQNPLR